jgi:hypothetical protein
VVRCRFFALQTDLLLDRDLLFVLGSQDPYSVSKFPTWVLRIKLYFICLPPPLHSSSTIELLITSQEVASPTPNGSKTLPIIYRKLIGQITHRLSSPKYSQLPNANLPALTLKITERRSSSPSNPNHRTPFFQPYSLGNICPLCPNLISVPS